jgi:hypothetical protein
MLKMLSDKEMPASTGRGWLSGYQKRGQFYALESGPCRLHLRVESGKRKIVTRADRWLCSNVPNELGWKCVDGIRVTQDGVQGQEIRLLKPLSDFEGLCSVELAKREDAMSYVTRHCVSDLLCCNVVRLISWLCPYKMLFFP